MGVGGVVMSKDRTAIIPKISQEFAASLPDLQWLFLKAYPLSSATSTCLMEDITSSNKPSKDTGREKSPTLFKVIEQKL